jgi:hypothetical protein
MNLRRTLAPLLATGLAVASVANADLVLPAISQGAKVTQTIGITDLSLIYSRPGVKNRTIWGDLVPYDKPWRTGANASTSFTTTDDIMVSGQKLAAGTYSIVTIPAKDAEWTVIFSNQKDLQGTAANYDPKQDALRVKAKPTAAEFQEWMRLGFENLTPTSTDLTLRWEKLAVAVPIQVEVNEKVLASARKEIAAAKPDDWRTPYRAASWAFDNNVALPEAKSWLDKSLAISKAYSNQNLQARWLMKDGKKTEAIAVAKKAVEAGKAATPPADVSATEKLIAEWTVAK